MTTVLKKLNWVHIGLILILPIILALINPNWIFNPFILDDYIYLGHQIAFPRYADWSSASYYFIDRQTLILPGYIVRQIFSPLMSNFILHLGVYYLASFSVYAILNKLFNQHTGLFITLLFGQYPLIMRSVGWDYTDGIGMALLTLGIYFLTQSIGSSRQNRYYIASGCALMLALGANFFNLAYVPFIALYWLALTRFRIDLRHWFRLLAYLVMGIIATYSLLALIYYSFTNQILFSNSLGFVQQYSTSVTSIDFSGYNHIHPYWNLFSVFVALICMWMLLRSRTYAHIERFSLLAVSLLFTGSFGILCGLTVWGLPVLRFSFYNTSTMMSAFLVLGVMFSIQLNQLSLTQIRYVTVIALTLPLLAHFIQTFWYSPLSLYIYLILFCICVVLMLLYGLIKNVPFRISLLIMFIVTNSIMIGRISPVLIYYPNRMVSQNMYEKAISLSSVINGHYDTLDTDTFQVTYDVADPYVRTFHATCSLYVPTYRCLTPLPSMITILEQQVNSNQSQGLVRFSSDIDSTAYIPYTDDLLNTYFEMTLDERVIVEGVDADIWIDFITLAPKNIFSDNRLVYEFSIEQYVFVLEESGFHGYEQLNGVSFRWTSEQTARLMLDASGAGFDATANYHVSFLIAGYLEEEVVTSLTLSINGVPVPLERSADRYVGQILGQYLLNPTLELIFQTSDVTNPFDLGIQDGRRLGVAIGELVIDLMITSE